MIASWRYDLATANVLWRRDLMRFLKQPSRIIGAMGQPLIFWFVVGAGLSPNFEIANLEMDYQAYFYPGVVLMVLLFAAIFSSMSVIEDRRIGFLQCVMAGPGSRMSLVLGKMPWFFIGCDYSGFALRSAGTGGRVFVFRYRLAPAGCDDDFGFAWSHVFRIFDGVASQ